nr:hypothetical protein [Tanacetum cinerariifolium]
MTIQKAVQIAGTLTDEVVRNGSIKKNPEKKGNGREPSKDKNGKDDNKRTRTGNAFATTTDPVRKENTGMGWYLYLLVLHDFWWGCCWVLRIRRRDAKGVGLWSDKDGRGYDCKVGGKGGKR